MQGVRWTEQDLAAFQARRAGHTLVSGAARPVAADTPPRTGNGRRGGSAVARLAHHQDQAGSTPAPAPAARRSLKRPEQELQKAQVAFLDWALMAPWRFLHVPNGGFRTPAEAGLMKALGQKEGAADLLFLGPAWPFVWVENKAPKGRLSPAQEDWRDWCRSIGAPWFLCRSMDDLVAACADAGIPLRGRPQ